MKYTAVRFKRNFSKATRLGTPTCPALNYDSSTNRLTGIGGLTIGYDAAGNQLNDICSTYEYDAEGRVKHSSSAGQWQYPMYNALGQRVMDDQGGAKIKSAVGLWATHGATRSLSLALPHEGRTYLLR